MKIYTLFISAFLLMSCQNQNNEKEDSEIIKYSEAFNIPETIKMLEQNSMILYRRNPVFLEWEKNQSEFEKENQYIELFQLFNDTKGNILKNLSDDEFVDLKDGISDIYERLIVTLMAQAIHRSQGEILEILKNMNNYALQRDFKIENKDKILLDLSILENMTLNNFIHLETYIPYKFNQFIPFVSADNKIINLNDSIDLNIGIQAYDSLVSYKVVFTDNPKDLDNNQNLNHYSVYPKYEKISIKGAKKGNHTIYGKILIESNKGEDIWLPWQFNYTVK